MRRSVAAGVLCAMIVLGCMAGSAGAGTDRELVGTWQLAVPVVDSEGNACPFVPRQMEFTSRGMVTMAGMPMGPIPFRTDLGANELSAIYARQPALKGEKILVMRPSPQMEWTGSPMVYGYRLSADTLDLVLPGWPTAVFRRVK